MPVLVVCSTKGGSGKTTVALTIASELLESGARVKLLDADIEGSLSNWFDGYDGEQNQLTLKRGVTEDSVMDDIAEASAATPFVIVDVEGTANMTMIKAATMADLVIIPQKASPLDWERTAKTVKGIRDAARMSGREIPYRVVITQTNQVARPKQTVEIIAKLRAKVPTFDQELFDLEAFRSMFLYRKTLAQLARDGDVKTVTARLVAKRFVAETMLLLKGSVAV